jgi:hypothetical protein
MTAGFVIASPIGAWRSRVLRWMGKVSGGWIAASAFGLLAMTFFAVIASKAKQSRFSAACLSARANAYQPLVGQPVP